MKKPLVIQISIVRELYKFMISKTFKMITKTKIIFCMFTINM